MKLGPDIRRYNTLLRASGWDHPRVGDIIFVGPLTKSVSNAGQAVLRKGPAPYSHVALNFTGDLCIHSTPAHGVGFDTTSDIISSTEYKVGYIVYRYKKFTDFDINKLYEKMLLLTSPYFGRKYNYAIFVSPKTRFRWARKSANNTFCSELITNFYHSIGIETSARTGHTTLPIDIYRYIVSRQESWEDVSDCYKQYLRDGTDEGELGLRENICVNQKSDITFAMRVTASRVQQKINESRMNLKSAVRSRWFSANDSNKKVKKYRAARSAYIIYSQLTRYSMAAEYRELFYKERRALLRKIVAIRRSLWSRSDRSCRVVRMTT